MRRISHAFLLEVTTWFGLLALGSISGLIALSVFPDVMESLSTPVILWGIFLAGSMLSYLAVYLWASR
jgi:hypothetical protein